MAVTQGRPYTTDDVAEKLSLMSTVTPGDTYAVLMNLGHVLSEMMNSGRSVKLKGVGTFYYTCRSEGQGVDTPEEVSAAQITSSQVRFIPEYGRNQQGKVNDRTLIKPDICWVDIEEEANQPQSVSQRSLSPLPTDSRD